MSLSAASGKENISPKKNNLKSVPTQSSLSDFFNLPNKKRPLQSTPSTSSDKTTKKPRENGFRQMHLTHLPLLHTCPQCLMSYVRGGDDEGTHEKHHARVTRGIIWDGLGRGKRAAKSKSGSGVGDSGWRVIRENVPFAARGKGRILVADGSYGGTKVCPLTSRFITDVDLKSWTISYEQSILSSLPHPYLSRYCRNARSFYSPPPPRLQADYNQPKAHQKKGSFRSLSRNRSNGP